MGASVRWLFSTRSGPKSLQLASARCGAMKVSDSVRLAINDWEHGEQESAMLHACNSVDGTAKKVYPDLSNKLRFTQVLRNNYGVLGPMGAPGINVVETRFPIKVGKPTAPGGEPDLADVIYAIHRCTHGHGDELPCGYELIPDAAGPPGVTHVVISKGGGMQLSDRVIFGLLAVAVLSPVNKDQRVPDGYHLTFGRSARLMINEWWGRVGDFPAIAALEPMPLVKLDFSSWVHP